MKLSIVEALKIACKLEKNGYDFYNNLLEKTKDDKLIDLLNNLAKAELGHKALFEKLVDKHSLEKESMHYGDNEDVEKYLDVLLGAHIFIGDISLKKDKNKINMEQILNFAIQAEKDSILYFGQMSVETDGEVSTLFKKIMEEEKKHFVLLSEYKNKIAKQ